MEELFRYRKARKLRVYTLRAGQEHPEVWVVTDAGRRSRRLAVIENAEDLRPFAESIEQELRAGGWALV